ncbi:MAG: hypothetical protein PHN49_10405 [Candidatus Omnitrophica bacterium]|nr:hypothetical protein [Candidatus Omnitrophota bacterium]MDD5672041.1 hypothetical protein [Candidatus Omnitrophota bacterium]
MKELATNKADRKAKARIILWGVVAGAWGCAIVFLTNVTQGLILLLPVLSAYLLTSRLLSKDFDLIDKINITFLILCCSVVLMTEILSVFESINPARYLLAGAVLFLLCFACSPKVGDCVRADSEQLGEYQNRFWFQIKGNKILAAFLCVFLLSLVWRIFLILYVPPNNWDSMAYHLSRVAYWMQNHSLHQFDTHYWYQVIFPLNAEILLLWTMIASRSDNLCGFIQLVCYLLSGTLIVKCVRRYIQASIPAAVTVMLFWYSLPETVLQSTSTQNDLVVAYFSMCSLVYFLTGASSDGHGKGGAIRMIVSAVALAFAFGTKLSIVLYAAPFLFLAVVLFFSKRISAKKAGIWVAALVVSFLLIGSYNYIQNYIRIHHFISTPHVMGLNRVQMVSATSVISNFFQHAFTLLTSQTGFQFYIGQYLSEIYNCLAGKMGDAFFWTLHIPTNVPGAICGRPFVCDDWLAKFRIGEDTSLFGLAGAVLLVSAGVTIWMGIVSLFMKRSGFKRRYTVFAFLFLGYLGCLSGLLKWNVWSGRYLVTAVLVGMPLLAVLFEKKTVPFRIITGTLSIYCILSLIPVTFMNVLKPLTALRLDRIGLRCLPRPDMADVFRKFNVRVPLEPGCRVGIFLVGSHWDYPLFGEKLQRTIVPVNLETLRRETFDYLIVSEGELEKNDALKTAVVEKYLFLEKLGNRKDPAWRLSHDLDWWIIFKAKRHPS